MKLFLASYWKHPETVKSLMDFTGGLENKTIAYIPTAANGEDGWESWKTGGGWKRVNEFGAKIKVVQLEEYRNDLAIKDIIGKDILWIAGGMPGYLMYWIKRCGIDKEIRNILDSGTMIVGSSAGAMVMGQNLEIAEFGFTDGEIGAKDIKPMGLVDFDIFPHYGDQYYEDIKRNYQGKKIYLLKDGEQIIVDENKVEVQGEERIITS